MKKTIITATAVMCTVFGAFAQNMTQAQTTLNPQAGGAQHMQRAGISPEDRAKRMADQVNSAVQLSPEQYKKVLNTQKEFVTKMEAFRTANQGQAPQAGAPDRREQMKAMNEEKDNKLKAILTPEQWQKYMDSRKMMPRPGMGGGNMNQNTAPVQH